MIENLIKKMSSMNLPESAIESMYNIIAAGNGPAIVRLKDGVFAERIQGEYIEIPDIFAWVVGRVPNAPGFIVRKAKEMMQSESSNVATAVKGFCESGKAALIEFSDENGEPTIKAAIIKDNIVTKIENKEILSFFKSMINRGL